MIFYLSFYRNDKLPVIKTKTLERQIRAKNLGQKEQDLLNMNIHQTTAAVSVIVRRVARLAVAKHKAPLDCLLDTIQMIGNPSNDFVLAETVRITFQRIGVKVTTNKCGKFVAFLLECVCSHPRHYKDFTE